MYKDIKMLAMDLDGTLLNKESRISPQTLKVLGHLKSEGVKLVVSTGRSFSACKLYANQIHADYIVCCNGAIVYDTAKREVLFHKPLPKEVAIEVIQDLYRYKDHLKIQWDGVETYFSNNILPFEEDYINAFKEAYPQEAFSLKIYDCIEESIEEIMQEEIYQIFTFAFDQRHKPYYKDVLTRLNQFEEIAYVDFSDGYTDIIHREATKGNGLLYLSQYQDIHPNEMMIFGDNHNDRSMFEYAGTGVAMGNAHKDIKEISSHLAGDHHEDGVARFLVEYFDLQQKNA
ncbi:MAG TPA: hypothetical protein DHN33_00030 [Eubacteriaceae bacterium]|nr:hypothetical protein [Eubacteriaceae bacterium]